jgi:hypothetical protein
MRNLLLFWACLAKQRSNLYAVISNPFAAAANCMRDLFFISHCRRGAACCARATLSVAASPRTKPGLAALETLRGMGVH